MKVICINNVGLEDRLKLGREYEAIEEVKHHFMILNENGISWWYPKSRFKKSSQEEEIDELKLKQDMIDFLIKENKSLKNNLYIKTNVIQILQGANNLLIDSILGLLERIPRPIRYIIGVGALTRDLKKYIEEQNTHETN